MVLIIDNYDSFTYNLVQHLGELGADLRVLRNDAIALDAVEEIAPNSIVISPGPGLPQDAGFTVELIQRWSSRVPILGVCLGHQAIGVAFGADIGPAPVLLHGKTSLITHDGKGVFAGMPAPFEAGRYHSLVLSKNEWPQEIVVTATCENDGTIMGIRHRSLPVHGVQFHPESVLTNDGRALLENFLDISR